MQIVYIDLIPQDEKPIVKISQYDNDRLVRFMLLENKEEYTLSGNESIDVNIKKPDGNIVVITPEITANNYVDVLFTEQASACYGESIGELSIKENSTIIGTCNFIMDVEKSPTCGGIESDSAIANLKTQVDAITMEYLINNTDEIAEIIADKIYPTLEAYGDIATFNTILQLPFVSVTADPLANIITRCGKNLARSNYSSGASKTSSGVTFTNNNGVVNVSAEMATGTAYYDLYANIDGSRLQIKAGTYTVSCAETTSNCTISFAVIGGSLYVMHQNTHSVTFTVTQDTELYAYVRVSSGASNINLNLHFQIEVGSTATASEPYNAITKPIADATTIITLTGINNVFTDHGPVTVEYKYFPDV